VYGCTTALLGQIDEHVNKKNSKQTDAAKSVNQLKLAGIDALF